jgi:hypothetical protein
LGFGEFGIGSVNRAVNIRNGCLGCYSVRSARGVMTLVLPLRKLHVSTARGSGSDMEQPSENWWFGAHASLAGKFSDLPAARGVRKVTTGIPGLWRPSVHSDVDNRSFDVGSIIRKQNSRSS